MVCFELYEGEQLVYAIFFGTKSLEGCDKMKQAIWKVAPFGDFKFRGSPARPAYTGRERYCDFSLLEKALQEQFASKGWQKIEDVEDFVKSDATDFHSGHLKRKTLTRMEKNGKIEVERPLGRRAASPLALVFFFGEGNLSPCHPRDIHGPYELVDNVDYGNHQQALAWLAEHYAGPVNVATGYIGLEGLDALAQLAAERPQSTRLLDRRIAGGLGRPAGGDRR